jgi:hypothetical protein
MNIHIDPLDGWDRTEHTVTIKAYSEMSIVWITLSAIYLTKLSQNGFNQFMNCSKKFKENA